MPESTDLEQFKAFESAMIKNGTPIDGMKIPEKNFAYMCFNAGIKFEAVRTSEALEKFIKNYACGE